MAANKEPIFPLVPFVGFAKFTTANTATDGTGTTGTLATATASGLRCERIKCRPLGTNVQTVLRIFYNNGSTSATATNNSIIAEIPLPATVASNVDEIGQEIELKLGFSIPNTAKIIACIGTAVAAGWQVTLFGGMYE